MRQKPNDAIWTDSQWQAIVSTGSDILVAAAAGSGKTAVLVERIIQRIIHDQLSLDELLVVTFTNASAKEMKARIKAALLEAESTQPSHHLRAQIIKMNAAEISTLHSFCLNLIEQYYYTINLDPVFRTATEEEVALMLMQSIDEVLEEYYETPDEQFLKTTFHLGSDRSDQSLRHIILKLYQFAIANPFPEDWLTAIAEDYRGMTIHHPLFTMLNELTLEKLDKMTNKLDAVLAVLDDTYSKQRDYAIEIRDYVDFIRRHPQDLYQNIHSMTMKTPPYRFKKDAIRLDEDEENWTKDTLNEVKELHQELKAYYYAPLEEMAEDIRSMADEVEVLTQITLHMMKRYTAKKRDKKIIDFSDYEHLALSILVQDGKPTEIAENLKGKYREILVDEYQDTNRVQETLLQVLNDNHLFMVGDVKQSIYKFRQAEPALFMEKYKRFRHQDGLVIDLAKNFRSRRSVIDDTNAVFQRIMDETVGEVAYDDKQKLYYGANFDDNARITELNIIDYDAPKIEEQQFIARRIKEIIASEQVYDAKKGSYRPAEYRDIVILTRSMTRAPEYQAVMKQHQIPFYTQSTSGYFQTDEITTILSLLRIIDNPLQDIHLAGVMRSILYQFDAVELTEIRAGGQHEYLYQNLKTYTGNAELKLKVSNFLKDIEHFKAQANGLGTRELLHYIYGELFALEKYSMLPGGAQRSANLTGLMTKASEFEKSSYRGLFQFIRYIDNMLEQNKDFGEVNIVSDEANVVRMMTVHKSKGLEFPFVIYAGLGTSFNLMDLSGPIILNQKYGMAIDYYNAKEHFSFPTLMTLVFKDIARRESISEELRLMYVAFTRAKEKLIMTGRAKESEVSKWQTLDVSPASYRERAASPLALIAPSVLGGISTIDVSFVHEQEAPEQKIDVLQQNKVESADWLEERATYIYPYLDVNTLPTKESVSEIKRQTEVDDDATTWTLINQYQLSRATYDRPKFLQQQAKTAAEKGTLMHTVMQHFPYAGYELDDATINKYLDVLVDKKIISGLDKESINVAQLVKYTQSDIYQMISSSDEVYKELPFVIGKSYLTGEKHPHTQNEQLVQGMIDCVFKYDGNYYFVDFKTDQIVPRLGNSTEETIAQISERYRVQMYYYQKALEEILNERVTGYLYFLENKSARGVLFEA